MSDGNPAPPPMTSTEEIREAVARIVSPLDWEAYDEMDASTQDEAGRWIITGDGERLLSDLMDALDSPASSDKGLREEVEAQSIPEVWSAGTARLVSGWRDGESRALAIAVMALRSIESQEPDTHELTLAHMMAQSAREALTLIQEVMEP